MDDITSIEATEDEAAQIQAEIQYYFSEIEQANERMKKDQAEIERLKSRTRAILAELAQLRAA